MYINEADLVTAASKEWDVIVVGAGAVGLILAVSLGRADQRVLLLDSGARDNSDANDLNAVVMTGRQHLGATHGRARTIGGTTTLWGGQLTRFVPYDFDARQIMADCAWPIRYEDIERFYTDVARMLDLDLHYLSDASVQGAIESRKPADTAGCEVFFTRWLRETNLARWFAGDLENRTALEVAPSCHATEILCRADGAQVSGIKAVSSRGQRLEFHARRVVLAAGTLEISRLLLLTAKNNPRVAWAGNANVGRYFQDHLDLVVGQIESKNKKAFANLFENVILNGHKYQPKIRMRTAVLRDLGCLNIACTVRFDSSIGEDIHLLKQFFKSLLTGARVDKPWQSIKRMVSLSHVWFPLMWRYVRHRRILAIADRGVSVIAHCEQRPLKESRISLDPNAADRFGDPIAQLHWVVDEELQMRSLQSFIRELQGFLRSACDADLTPVPAILAGDTAVLAQASDSYHQCGGARMSLGAADGVVDADCKVFGTDNLYVAGAAVFPSASFANPTYTAMALACRLGNHLIAERDR